MITTNESWVDRIIRVVFGILLMYLGFVAFAGNTWDFIFKFLGITLALTGLIGWCPIYTLFRFTTRRNPAG